MVRGGGGDGGGNLSVKGCGLRQARESLDNICGECGVCEFILASVPFGNIDDVARSPAQYLSPHVKHETRYTLVLTAERPISTFTQETKFITGMKCLVFIKGSHLGGYLLFTYMYLQAKSP